MSCLGYHSETYKSVECMRPLLATIIINGRCLQCAHKNIPINFKSAKIVDFMMPRYEVIKQKIEHFIVVTATLQL